MKFIFNNVDIDVTPHSHGHWMLSADFGDIKVKSLTTDSELIDRVYEDSDERAWHIIKDALWDKFAYCVYTFNADPACCENDEIFSDILFDICKLHVLPKFKAHNRNNTSFDDWDLYTTKLDLDFDSVKTIYTLDYSQLILALSSDIL